MVKSKASMTYRSRYGGMVSGSAGDYPEKMLGLVDGDGHISLDPADYAKYSRDEVESFLASRPYETHVLFAPDGTILSMKSQWSEDSVSFSIRDDEKAILGHGGALTTGDGYTDMHFHPEAKVGHTIQVFSKKDIGTYITQVKAGYHGRWPYPVITPDTYRVKAFDGTRFELKYVGGGKYDVDKFKAAYSRQMNNAKNAANGYYIKHGGYDRFIADEMAARTDKWLRRNAKNYGFEYNSNWTMNPLT